MRGTTVVRAAGAGSAPARLVRVSVLVVALGAALLAAAYGAAGTAAAQGLTLTPSSGRPGDTVRLGRDFVLDCAQDGATGTTVAWPGLPVQSSSGTVAALVVPSLAPGTYDVTVECVRSDGIDTTSVRNDTAGFTVLPEPEPVAITLTPPEGEPGTTVTATGTGFTEKCLPDGAAVRVAGTPVEPLSGPTLAGGVLTVTFEVPDLPAGGVEVVLTCPDGPPAGARFTLLAGPTPTPTPTPVPVPVPPIPPVILDLVTIDVVPVPPPGVERTEFVRSVPPPGALTWTVPAVLVSAVLVGFLFWALGFPSEPFNKTLEQNRERIRRWFAARGDPLPFAPDGWGGFVLYAVLAAALLMFVEPETGPSADRAAWISASALGLGFLVAVPLTTLAYAVPAELHARRTAEKPAVLRFLPGAMLFAAGCVAFSRWVDLQPGYVYGLFAFYAAAASARRERAAGPGVLYGSVCLLAVSLAAWLAWPRVAATAALPGARYEVLVLDAALAATFVLGVQTLVFGLVPITFLDGHTLRRWSPPAWALVWGLSLALLVHAVSAKLVAQVHDPAAAVKAAAAFLAFGALSAGCWLAFRLRGPTGAGAAEETGGAGGSDRGGGARAPVEDDRVRDTGTRRLHPVATVVVTLLVAVPATVVALGWGWGWGWAIADPPPTERPAVVTFEALRVRAGPTTASAHVVNVHRGDRVTLSCARGNWMQLAEPHPGGYVHVSGLDLPQGRPPAC